MRILLSLLVLALPVLDIFITRAFAQASNISVMWWFVFSAVVGVYMLRHERAHFRSRFMAALTSASVHEPNPWRGVLDSGRKVIAGALLLLPGVLSDVLALTLMLVPLNVASRLIPAWATSTRGDGPITRSGTSGRTVDGSYRRVD